MSTDISLLLEYHDGDGWRPALHVADRVADPRTHLGILSVCWWSVRSRPTSLFFGNDALFPLHPGLPADLSPRMQEHVWPNFRDDSNYAGWIALPDLNLPSWHKQTVIVGGPVQARYASLFRDGKQSPPMDALRQVGIAEPVLERVTDWKNERKLEFKTAPSYKRKPAAGDFLVQVTWVETLVEIAGRIWRDGLAGLADLEEPERYRIVTCTG